MLKKLLLKAYKNIYKIGFLKPVHCSASGQKLGSNGCDEIKVKN
jgi:hypothetical protein